MRTQSIDTPPQIEEILLERLRQMSTEERLQRMYELTAAAKSLAAEGIRARHGEIDERELHLRLGALCLERRTMIEVFGWDPDERGY